MTAAKDPYHSEVRSKRPSWATRASWIRCRVKWTWTILVVSITHQGSSVLALAAPIRIRPWAREILTALFWTPTGTRSQGSYQEFPSCRRITRSIILISHWAALIQQVLDLLPVNISQWAISHHRLNTCQYNKRSQWPGPKHKLNNNKSPAQESDWSLWTTVSTTTPITARKPLRVLDREMDLSLMLKEWLISMDKRLILEASIDHSSHSWCQICLILEVPKTII